MAGRAIGRGIGRWVTLAALLALSGCTTLWQALQGQQPRQGASSSLVDFLYPEGREPPPVDERIPRLSTPLRVGVAFVPSREPAVQGLSEARRSELLDKAKASFQDRDFISEIVTIPDTYLRARRGFDTLDQVARLYDLDVIALVSYDQVAVADDTRASLLYWTIVGAYVIKGSRNDVQTFVDTAIFDVPTRKLLFRAPGTNMVKATATLVESTAKMREAREESFTLAMQDMTNNLDTELERFKERIKEDQSVVVTSRKGSGGVGFTDPVLLLFAGACALALMRRLRRS